MLLSFDPYAAEARRKREAARLRAAKSTSPDIHRLAVVVSEMLAAYRVTDPDEEHRLTAKQLGVGGRNV